MWLPSSRLPPSGESSREASTSFALVVGRAWASSPQPSGIGLPQRETIVSLPTATVVVAMSRTNGMWRAAAAARLSGLVPVHLRLGPRVHEAVSGPLHVAGQHADAVRVTPRRSVRTMRSAVRAVSRGLLRAAR